MSTVYEFQSDLNMFSHIMDIRIEKAIRYIALELFGQITLRWPVDTGYSRANWRIGVGEPDLTVTPPPDPADRGKNRQIYPPPSPDTTDLTAITGKEPVFITNSVEYAIYLEEGHSKQAPSGAVRISMAQIEAKIDNIIQKAKSE